MQGFFQVLDQRLHWQSRNGDIPKPEKADLAEGPDKEMSTGTNNTSTTLEVPPKALLGHVEGANDFLARQALFVPDTTQTGSGGKETHASSSSMSVSTVPAAKRSFLSFLIKGYPSHE